MQHGMMTLLLSTSDRILVCNQYKVWHNSLGLLATLSTAPKKNWGGGRVSNLGKKLKSLNLNMEPPRQVLPS